MRGIMTTQKKRTPTSYKSKPKAGDEVLIDLAHDNQRARDIEKACKEHLADLRKHHHRPPPDVRVRRSTAWRNGLLAPDREMVLQSNLGWASDRGN